MEHFKLGKWFIHTDICQLSNGLDTRKIPPKLMRLLAHLASHAGEVISKEEINDAVWEGAHVTDDALTHSISQLRKALGDCNGEPRYIRTIPKRGYQLVAKVSPEPELTEIYNIKPLRLAILLTASLSGIDHQPVADRLTDELLVRLIKKRLFRVISRTSVRSCKSNMQPQQIITKQLAVDLVLEGHLTQAGQVMRVTMGLIDANDEYLWAELYEISSDLALIDQHTIAETIIEDLARNCGRALG